MNTGDQPLKTMFSQGEQLLDSLGKESKKTSTKKGHNENAGRQNGKDVLLVDGFWMEGRTKMDL